MARPLRTFISAPALILLILETILVTAAYITAAYTAYEGNPEEYLIYGSGAITIALAVATVIVCLYLQDLYIEIVPKSHLALMQQIAFTFGATFLVQGASNYLDHSLRMPLRIMVPGSLLAMTTIWIVRVIFGRYALEWIGGDRLLFIGNNSVLAEIESYVDVHPERCVRILGRLDDDNEDRNGAKFLGRLDALSEVVNAARPSRIVIGMHERRARLPVGELLELRYRGHLIEEAAATYERICGRVCTKELRPSQLIYSSEFGPRRRMLWQRFINLGAAVLGLAAAPVFIAAALAIRLTSRGPVLCRQVRVGRDGVPFTLYRFRCARLDAAGDGDWTAGAGQRFTTVGRILRGTHCDGLPQLFNVLKGDMSIVGPRPERPEFVKILSQQIPYYRQRHAVRPGITGWAQINHECGDYLEDTITRLEYDLYYIKNISWSLDVYIILHTMKSMLAR